MNVLLDSHTLLWWLADDKRLSKKARSAIAKSDATVFVSAASVWEIAIKISLGKLDDPSGALHRFPLILRERGLTELPISAAHAVEAASLPRKHRDPFDRMLVAQSRVEGLPLVSDDPVLKQYGARILW